ncbi:response regulator [Pseudomonadota bacterium]
MIEREIDTKFDKLKNDLAEAERNFQTVFYNSIDAALIIAGETFIDCNNAAVKLLGASSKEDVLSTHPSALSPETQPDGRSSFEKANEMISIAFKQGFHHFEWTHKKFNGEAFPVEVSLTRIENQGDVLLHVLLKDLAQQRNAENELRKTLEAANTSNHAKSEFLATMSHEIRTPLNAIIGMADLLSYTPLNIEQREYIDIFKSSGENLLQLINDILDVSKVEAGQLNLEKTAFDIEKLIENTCDILAIKAHTKNLELVVDNKSNIPAIVIGDPNRLEQIFVNLLGNAIKFTDSGEIVLGVEMLKEKDQKVKLRFSVRDTGIGIADDKKELMFESFSQEDKSTTRKYGGTGLGLAISSQLVKKMGGEIWIESEKGEGSTFYFTAQFEIPEQEISISNPYVDSAISSKRILIVDDNATNRLILRKVLESWGATVTESDSGEQALRTMENARGSNEIFDVVLLDCNMPNMDGFETANHIKDDLRFSGITLIMLTSDNRGGNIEQAKKSGINGYMVKPVKPAVLHDSIISLLSRNSHQRLKVDKTITSDPTKHVMQKIDKEINVLVVDDDLINQKVAANMLAKKGYNIIVADGGKEAVNLFSRDRPDLILMDVNMPEMDGHEATRNIRRLEERMGGHTPIIAVTALAFKEDQVKCLASGMDAYISKPIRSQLLFSAIESFLSTEIDNGNDPGITTDEDYSAGENCQDASIFDVKKSLVMMNGDADMFQELIKDFMTLIPGYMRDIVDAVSHSDSNAIQLSAHKLKGAVSNFKADNAYDAASALEKSGRFSDLSNVDRQVEQLKLSMEQLITALDIFLDSPQI